METAKRQAQLLHIYVLELKTCLKRIDDLHMLQLVMAQNETRENPQS